MPLTIKRYRNQARLHVGSGLFLVVQAALDFTDDGTPTGLRAQVLDWRGRLTYQRPLSAENVFHLAALYDRPHLQLPGLKPSPCEIGDVRLGRTEVEIHVRGPLTARPLSTLLAEHYCRLAGEGALCADH